MTPYLDALDLSRLDPTIADTITTGLVHPALAALADAGLQVEVSTDLGDCRAFWERNDGALDLVEFPAFDSAFHDCDATGLFLVREGRQVGMVWKRKLHLWDARRWAGKSLEQAINDGTMLYGVERIAVKERCNSALARSIRCSNPVLGGAVWLEPTERRAHHFSALSRLSRVQTVAAMQPWHDFVLLVCRDNPNGGAGNLSFRTFGVTRLEDGVQWDGQRYLIGHATLEETVRILMDTAGTPLNEPFAQRL